MTNDYPYPPFVVETSEAIKVAANLHATLAYYGSNPRPVGVDLWVQGMSRYVHLMLWLSFCLLMHPKWAEELNTVLEPIGCPAQKIPLIEEFLRQKGVMCEEGTALVIPE